MTDSPKNAHTRAVERAGRLGRRVGMAIYFVVLGYMVVVGFGTFVRGIFHPTAEARVAVGDCVAERVALAGELHRQAAASVLRFDYGATASFYEAWDARLESLRPRCGDEPGFRELERLRHRVDIQLRRFEHENGDSFQRTLRAGSSTETTP